MLSHQISNHNVRVNTLWKLHGRFGNSYQMAEYGVHWRTWLCPISKRCTRRFLYIGGRRLTSMTSIHQSVSNESSNIHISSVAGGPQARGSFCKRAMSEADMLS